MAVTIAISFELIIAIQALVFVSAPFAGLVIGSVLYSLPFVVQPLQNAFEVNYDLPVGETFALINVGASVVNINVLQSRVSAFTRDISQGGNQ